MPVWQKAHKLVLNIYDLSAKYPKEEIYSLTSQTRRSALSVTGNIAEAFGRFHYLDKNKFYLNARGSLEETRNYLILSMDLGYTEPNSIQTLIKTIEDVSEELNKLIKTLKIRNQLESKSKSQSQSQSQSPSQSKSQSQSQSQSQSKP
jgi:four helix bundle protein